VPLRGETVEYRKLGNSDLEASVISLGAWQFGCERFWGKVAEKDAYEVIADSRDKGINMIDTAIGYDDSEIIVGKAIQDVREKFIVVSKGGADPRKIPKRVDLSLKRMGLDCIDLYLVHYPDADIPIEDTIGAMVEIRNRGKIRYIGVSNFTAEQLTRAQSVADIACCEQAYNLMWREIEETGVLEVCHEKNIGVLAYSPLGQGLFTGKIRSTDDIPVWEGDIRHRTLLFQGEAFERGLEMVKILDELSAKYGRTQAQIALNWVIRKDGVSSAIVGSKNRVQLDDNLGALGWHLDDEDYELLSSRGSQYSRVFDYSYSMFGMKYDEIKIDQMIDATL
jgi:aryl-alcohol dehydrogenase-like predicted oxidoreductase